MCGPSGGQTALSQEQADFYKELQGSYATEFAGQSAILSSLNAAFTPILNAGPNQQGFSAAENATLNTQAMNTTSRNYQNAARAVGSQLAARGGGNAYLPSGVNAGIDASIASAAAGQLSAEESQITQANYAQGRQNFFNAAGALSGEASLMNPTQYAGQATGAGGAAFQSATDIYNQGNAWQGLLGGVLGGALGSFGTGIGGGLAKKALGT